LHIKIEQKKIKNITQQHKYLIHLKKKTHKRADPKPIPKASACIASTIVFILKNNN